MGAGAVAGRRNAEPAWLGLVLGQHVGKGFERGAVGCNQNVREGGQVDHRGELLRAVGQLGVELGRNGVHGHVGQQQGMAVRLGFGHDIGPQRATCAGLVVDHDRLPPGLAQRLGDGAGQDVRGATGGKWHNDFDSLRRPTLRLNSANAERQGQ